jgi:hypothetical protein
MVGPEALHAYREINRLVKNETNEFSKEKQYSLSRNVSSSQLEIFLLLVREARSLFGDEGGRQVWRQLGLPVPETDTIGMRQQSSPLRDFIKEMVVKDEGCEISCRTLYLAYCDWHRSKSGNLLHQVAFGRALHKAGFRSKRYNGTVYIGVRLKSPVPPSTAFANSQSVGTSGFSEAHNLFSMSKAPG